MTDLHKVTKQVNEGCWHLTPDSPIQHFPFMLFVTHFLVTLYKQYNLSIPMFLPFKNEFVLMYVHVSYQPFLQGTLIYRNQDLWSRCAHCIRVSLIPSAPSWQRQKIVHTYTSIIYRCISINYIYLLYLSIILQPSIFTDPFNAYHTAEFILLFSFSIFVTLFFNVCEHWFKYISAY